jgi:hypothetical protein
VLAINSSQKLQAFIGGAAATTNPTVTVVFHDIPGSIKTDSGEYRRDSTYTVLAGATETDICSSPAQGTIRHIDSIIVFNADTADVVLTICTDVSGTNRIHFKPTLGTLRTFYFSALSGVGVI